MNLIKCPICRASLISEEWELHSCTPYKVVDIQYKWWVNSTLPKYGEVLLIEGEDGTLYRLRPRHPKRDTQTGHLEEGTVYIGVHC